MIWRITVAVIFGLIGLIAPQFDGSQSAQALYNGCLLAAALLTVSIVISLIAAAIRSR